VFILERLSKFKNSFSSFSNLHKRIIGISILILMIGFRFVGSQEDVNRDRERLPSQEVEVVAEDNPIYVKKENLANTPYSLTKEEQIYIVKNLKDKAKSFSSQFKLSDGLNLGIQGLNFLAGIGEYEIAQKDIRSLVKLFKQTYQLRMSSEVNSAIDQLAKIRFGRKKGKAYAQFFALNPERGIEWSINNVSTDPDSKLKEVRKLIIKDGAEIYFDEINRVGQSKMAKAFVEKNNPFWGEVISGNEELFRIDKNLLNQLDPLLMSLNEKYPPLWLDMKNIFLEVDTDSFLGKIDFELTAGMALPLIPAKNKERVSSLVIGGEGKFLQLRASIDQ